MMLITCIFPGRREVYRGLRSGEDVVNEEKIMFTVPISIQELLLKAVMVSGLCSASETKRDFVQRASR